MALVDKFRNSSVIKRLSPYFTNFVRESINPKLMLENNKVLRNSGIYYQLNLKNIDANLNTVTVNAIVKSIPSHSLFFIERGVKKGYFPYLRRIMDGENVNFVFHSKKDYQRFELFIQRKYNEDLDQRFSYIQKMEESIESKVYSYSAKYALYILNYIQYDLAGSPQFKGFSESLGALRFNFIDRLSPWIRIYLYLTDLINKFQVENFYYVGNNSSGLKLLNIIFEKQLNVKSYILNRSIVKNTSNSVSDIIDKTTKPIKKGLITRYNFTNKLESSDYILYTEHKYDLNDDQYNNILNNIVKDNPEHKVLVLQSDTRLCKDSIKDVDFSKQSLEIDNLPGFEEFSGSLDKTLVTFVESGLKIDENEQLLRLFVSLTTRRVLFRILRDSFALKTDTEKLKSWVNIRGIATRYRKSLNYLYLRNSMKNIPLIKIRKNTLFDNVLSDINYSIDVLHENVKNERIDSNTLIFVESSAIKRRADWVFEKVKNDKNTFVVFKSKKDYNQFIMKLDQADASQRVEYIQGIDPTIDEGVFFEADKYASSIIENLQVLFEKSEYSKFAQHIHSVNVNVSDRLVSWVRNYHFISNFIVKNGIRQFYHVGNHSISSSLLTFVINQSFGINSKIMQPKHISDQKNSIKVLDLVWPVAQPISRSFVTRFNFPISNDHSTEHFMFIGHFKDDMYRETLLPIVNKFVRLSNKSVLFVQPFNKGLGIDKKDLDPRVRLLTPTIMKDNLPGLLRFGNMLDHALNKFIEDGFNISHFDGLLRLYVSINARSGINRLLRDTYALKQDINIVLEKTKLSGIVSSPGRLWISGLLVDYVSDIPSFEIQVGTLTRTTRYKKLNSQYILSIDEFSKGVYVDYLGYQSDNVEVVGSPRIDKKLSVIKGFSKEQSRMEIAAPVDTTKILTIATQPYGYDIMNSMVKEAAKFVEENKDWFLLISMHPSEDESYESSYRGVLSSLLNDRRAFISHENVYHNLNASDAVVTYFSTTGLEAFCLNKPVFAYRSPKFNKVPYDLCELGVAKPFGSSSDLRNYLIHLVEGNSSSEYLERLQDGKSADRISHYILDKSTELSITKKLLEIH